MQIELPTSSTTLVHNTFWCPAQNPTFNVYNDHVEGHQALLAAQLAIMAANLQEGGHVVLRMSMTWTHFT